MQLSMLVLWLLELMLRKLGALKDAGAAPDSAEYRHAWNALERFTQQVPCVLETRVCRVQSSLNVQSVLNVETLLAKA